MASRILLNENDSTEGQRFDQDYLVVWLDPNSDVPNDDTQQAIIHVRQMINSVKAFSNINQCLDYLTDVKHERIWLILSNIHDLEFLFAIHDFPQLHFIYICSDSVMKDDQLKKLQGVFRNMRDLAKALIRDIREYCPDLLPMSILSTIDTSQRDLKKLPPEFLYSQILKEISLGLEYNANAMEDLVSYWYEQYADNEFQLEMIGSFERKYTPASVIYWYTAETFVYEILNYGLRTLDVDVVMKMSFFMRDLHLRLEQLCRQQMTGRTEFLVYRGQRMNNDDLKKLRHSEGGLLSFNSFLSTSLGRRVPAMFSDVVRIPDMTGVLFEMKIDPRHTRVPFAFVGDESNHPDEEEVLFSMHSVFRIVQVTENPAERRWDVKLTLTSDDDEQLRVLTDCIRAETSGYNSWQRLGQLLIRMGKWNKADEVYQTLLASTSVSNTLARSFFNNQLGHIWGEGGNYEKSLAFYHEALEIVQRSSPTNYLGLAKAHNNIASIEIAKGNYAKALHFAEEALQIHQKSSNQMPHDLYTFYNNLASIHDKMGNFPEASAFLDKALKLDRNTFPPNHPAYGQMYTNLGHFLDRQGNYQQALEKHQMALGILQRSLPATHCELARIHNNIGDLHRRLGHYLSALLSFQIAYRIQEQALYLNHDDLALTYNNIGVAHYHIQDFGHALQFLKKTSEIHTKYFPEKHPERMNNYTNIGEVYKQMGNFREALAYAEQALQICQGLHPPLHRDLAQIYDNIGAIYYSMKQHHKALQFHRKALTIHNTYINRDHPNVARTYCNIGVVQVELGALPDALQSFEIALRIGSQFLRPDHQDVLYYQQNVDLLRRRLEFSSR